MASRTLDTGKGWNELWARRRDHGSVPAVRWQPFVAWAIGSALALIVDQQAHALSTVVVGLLSAGIACAVIEKLTYRQPAAPATGAHPTVTEGVLQ
jgi:cytosine permease